MDARHRTRRGARPAPPIARPGTHTPRLALILLAFALLFTGLELVRSFQQSATWDEPMHLTAGYAALTAGDFRIDPSHPPLARMWAAIPLAISGPTLDTSALDRVTPLQALTRGYAVAREFVSGHDIDQTLFSARVMAIAWGVLLGVLVIAWAFEWLGRRAALVAACLFALEPNLAAHSALVTTDAPLAALVFGAVFFLWRYSQYSRSRDLAGLATCVSLAAITKFSAILLGPIIGILLVLLVATRQLDLRGAATIVVSTGAATVLVIWAAYEFRYAPSQDAVWLLTAEESGTVAAGWLGTAFNQLDTWHLLPNAFAQGLVYSLSSARELPAFLAGEVKAGGWWYYFPVTLALKTPLGVLGLAAIALVAIPLRRAAAPDLTAAFVMLPIVVWLLASASADVNLGVRHVLPVYPFIIVAATAGACALLDRRGLVRAVPALALLFVAGEVWRAEPYPISFFNAFAGGPSNGFRYLADSNLGWGGNLKALRRWMNEHGVPTVNLAYFGSVDPALYGIRATYLPSSATFLANRFGRPQLPGYVAISGTALDGVYLPEWWRRFYSGFLQREPVAVVANTLRIYWVDRWPDPATPPATAEHTRTLAEALLFALHWPERAIVHYREYLAREPDDPAGWKGMSVALAQTGRTDEAISGFRRVLTLAPADPDARRNLALLEQQSRTEPRDWPR